MLRRKMSVLEKNYIPTAMEVVVAYRVKDKKARDEVCEKLIKSVATFHMHVEGDDYVFSPRDVPVHRIPSGITDLKDQAFYLSEHFSKLPSIALGSIAISDDTVVFSTNHGVNDGGAIKDITECLSLGKEMPKLELPLDVFEAYPEQIENAKIFYDGFATNKNDVRYNSADLKNATNSFNSKCALSSLYDYEFKCFDKKDKKLHGLTESYFSSMVLSLSAMNGKFDKGGLWEVIGMRPYGNPKLNLRQGNHCTIIPVDLNGATNDTTIVEMMKMYRKDLQNKLKKNAHFAFWNAIKYGYPKAEPIPGAPTIRSSIGNLIAKGPLKDVFLMTHSVGGNYILNLGTITYCIDNGKEKRFNLTSTYFPTLISDREVQTFVDLTKYALKNLDFNTRIGDAVDILKEEEKKLFKKYENIERIVKV